MRVGVNYIGDLNSFDYCKSCDFNGKICVLALSEIKLQSSIIYRSLSIPDSETVNFSKFNACVRIVTDAIDYKKSTELLLMQVFLCFQICVRRERGYCTIDWSAPTYSVSG